MIHYRYVFWLDHSLEYGLQAMQSGLSGIEVQNYQAYELNMSLTPNHLYPYGWRELSLPS
jgi:hypothetical protein